MLVIVNNTEYRIDNPIYEDGKVKGYALTKTVNRLFNACSVKESIEYVEFKVHVNQFNNGYADKSYC